MTLHPAVLEHYRMMGRRGGPARKRALSPERRTAIARKAGKASGRARKLLAAKRKRAHRK